MDIITSHLHSPTAWIILSILALLIQTARAAYWRGHNSGLNGENDNLCEEIDYLRQQLDRARQELHAAHLKSAASVTASPLSTEH